MHLSIDLNIFLCFFYNEWALTIIIREWALTIMICPFTIKLVSHKRNDGVKLYEPASALPACCDTNDKGSISHALENGAVICATVHNLSLLYKYHSNNSL